MIKLADLHPEHGVADAALGRYWLMFDCQTTPGCRVYIQFHRAPPVPGVWQCTSPWKTFPGMAGEHPDVSCLSLQPSIGAHWNRRVLCQGHVTITNGEVTP